MHFPKSDACIVFAIVIVLTTPASGFPGVEDDLIFSGAGSGCNGDDEDECPPLPEMGSGDDDLITPVYVPPTKPPPTVKPKKKVQGTGKDCDDEDCIDGSGSGEITEDPFTSSKTTGIVTEITDSTTILDTSSIKTSTEEQPTVTAGQQHTTGIYSNLTTTDTGLSTTMTQHTTKAHSPTVYLSTDPTSTTTTMTTSVHRFTDMPNEINHRQPIPYPPHDYSNNIYGINNYNKVPPTQRIHSETSEVVALIIGIIAGALIAVILVILIILKFKSRNDRSFKIDDSKEYPHGPGTALLGNTASSTASQSQYQINGALRNGDKSQMQQKQKKRDSKDIKEWYV